LRGEEVVARGWRQPHELTDGLEWDSYDASALLIVGVSDGRLVATTRLLLPRPDRLLPTEELFGLRIEPLGQVVEGGRLVITRGHRDRRLLAGLFGAKWLELRARGYRHYCGNATPAVLRLYESFGFRSVVLAPPVRSWGELRVPARLDLMATAREAAARQARPRPVGEAVSAGAGGAHRPDRSRTTS
jgi:Acetyltransferase (GNAT) domain